MGRLATSEFDEQLATSKPHWLRWYLVLILGLVYAVNIADRYVVSTVMESIRLDLHLTDSGIAVLTGVSLALFYVTIGLPISALADRSNRRNIIAGALVLWSFMTLCCGFARTFWQMLAARVGVGVGEAGGTPPSTSMLADVFPPKERPMALTVYTLGAPIGAWLGASVAGRLADAFGWRAAFYGLGLPGIILGLVIFLTLREPKRGGNGRRRGRGGRNQGSVRGGDQVHLPPEGRHAPDDGRRGHGAVGLGLDVVDPDVL